jgi:hypothetical protein
MLPLLLQIAITLIDLDLGQCGISMSAYALSLQLSQRPVVGYSEL